MLLCFQSMTDEDHTRLMGIYRESNLGNIPYFFPDCENTAEGLRKVEERFIRFLYADFWGKPENTYYVWEEDGMWTSALRLTKLPEFYWVEALETAPGARRKGYAAGLYRAIFDRLKALEGSVHIRCAVGYRNEASLKAHERAGFQIKSRYAVNPLYQEPEEGCYLLAYDYTVCP